MTQASLVLERKQSEPDSNLNGIRRINERTLKLLREEDERWRSHDPEVWLAHYKLEDHHLSLEDLLVRMGHLRGAEGTDIAVRSSAAIHHDVGKRHELCRDYRRRRILTAKEKKAVRKHPLFSAQEVRRQRILVQKEDRDTLELLINIEKVVRWHDKPWHLFFRWLRIITWDLRFADSFLAQCEERETAAVIPSVALHSGIRRVLEETPIFVKVFYWREIKTSIKILRQAIHAQLK